MNRADITISIASGALTSLIVDTFIVGDISLKNAQDYGRRRVEEFVIKTAKQKDKEGKVTDLLSAVNFLEKNRNIDLVSGRADYFDGEQIWGESKFNGEITKKDILKSSPIIHPTVMMKKEMIDSIGGYLDYHRCEDYATWIELFVNNYKMYVLKDKLIRYHLSIEDYSKRTLKTRKGFFKMIKGEYRKLNPSKIQIIKIYIKTFIAGIMPWKIMFYYHKRKAK